MNNQPFAHLLRFRQNCILEGTLQILIWPIWLRYISSWALHINEIQPVPGSPENAPFCFFSSWTFRYLPGVQSLSLWKRPVHILFSASAEKFFYCFVFFRTCFVKNFQLVSFSWSELMVDIVFTLQWRYCLSAWRWCECLFSAQEWKKHDVVLIPFFPKGLCCRLVWIRRCRSWCRWQLRASVKNLYPYIMEPLERQ